MDEEAEPPTRFIILKADMTGDLWHVAAACALWPDCYTKGYYNPGSFAFAAWKPRPAIIIWENISDESDRDARTAFTYLQSISLKPVVVMISEGDQRFLNTLSEQYLAAVAPSFDDPQPKGWTGAVGAVAIARAALSRLAPSSNRQANGPRNDKRLVPLAATTAMVMQMMDFLGVQIALKLLGAELSAGLEEKIKTAVQNVVGRLAAYIGATHADRIVLLNYRQGQVNTQHDTNEQIKNSLKRKATEIAPRTIVV